MPSIDVVVLAAGRGTRMASSQPKVLQPIAGRSMLQHVLESAAAIAPRRVHLVVGHGSDAVTTAARAICGNALDLHVCHQAEQLGTGHAVLQALPGTEGADQVLVLCADVPLVQPETLARVVAAGNRDAAAPAGVVLTAKLSDPTGYGRIKRERSGQLQAIVEHKDATESERAIDEVNSGIMLWPRSVLADLLPRLGNSNAQGEYYLPDLVAAARGLGVAVVAERVSDAGEIQGVNDRAQQAQVERLYQRRAADALLAAGVALADPARFDCRGQLTVGTDCTIDVDCVFEGVVTLEAGAVIGPFCHIKDSHIGAGAVVKSHSSLEGARLGTGAQVGPFARLRPGTKLAADTRIGNFVEIKNTQLGEGSKVNHLSYVGDAVVGREVNIGAGTITCNYDGVNKHRTTIDNGVFVGSNSALVAPVTLAEGTTVAAGSTITRNTDPHQLAIGRSRQTNRDGWVRPQKPGAK